MESQTASSPPKVLSDKMRGKMLWEKGKKALDKPILSVAPFIKYDEAVQYFHKSALMYLACSRWREAAECLAECARIHSRFLKEERDAAIFLIQAAEITLKFEKNDAIRHFKSAIKIFCDIGDFLKAGNLQYEVAELQYGLRNMEEAAQAFRRGADLLASNPDRSDYCLYMSALCYTDIKEYKIACDLFMLVAEGSIQSNLRQLNSRTMLLCSVLCRVGLQAEPDDHNSVNKYEDILAFSESLEKLDFKWRGSKEALFVVNVIKARKEFDLHAFADHIYHWNLVKPLLRFQIVILQSFIYAEIQAEIDRKEKERDLARREAERRIRNAQRRRQKRLQREANKSDDDSDSGSDRGSDSGSESTESEKSADEESDDGDEADPVDDVLKDLANEFDDEDDEKKAPIPDHLKDANKTDKKYEKKWK